MYILLPYTEPLTQTPHPAAALVITNVRLQLEPPSAEYELAFYHDAAALAAQMLPFERRPAAPFTLAEIETLRAQFAVAVANVLIARPEFAAGSVVLP